MKRKLDMEFGAAELSLDDELVQDAQLAGWAMYKESFSEDDSWCRRTTGTPEGAFPLSGSKYTALCVVYDPSKWEIGPEPESLSL